MYHDKGVSRVLRRFWKINFYYDRELIQAYNKNFKNILTVLKFRYKSWWFLCYKRSLIDLTSARICQGCYHEVKKWKKFFIICEVEKQKFSVSNKKPYNFFLFFSCFFVFVVVFFFWGYSTKFILSDLLTCRRLINDKVNKALVVRGSFI